MAKRRPSRGVGEDLPRMTQRSDSIATLGETISGLVDFDANALCLQWRNHLGGSPPAHLPRWLLLRLLAYRMQAAALGGLDTATLRVLRHSKGQRFESSAAPFETRIPTRREWGQPESRDAARSRVEWQARTRDGPGEGLCLEWRDLQQPVADREGNDRHQLERTSVLWFANSRAQPICNARWQWRGLLRR